MGGVTHGLVLTQIAHVKSFLFAVFWCLLQCNRFFCGQDYFGECSEGVISDNMVTVYELLEEMLDNGFPLATESNVLKEMIKPPTILRSVVNTLTGHLSELFHPLCTELTTTYEI